MLQHYTSYNVAYELAQKAGASDDEVDSKKAAAKLGRWMRLHDYNIAMKVKEIVEHYRDTVMGLLGGRAKAMIVTGSRKEAVRYKLEFDKYVAKKGYERLNSMVAFSGEVTFSADDPGVEGLLDQAFTETGMNPGLKRRKLEEAFKTNEYQVMIVAQKFQTGFDQPKLCAMYVDKPLGGIECVQTLSRLNRKHDGKKQTYVLDFVNDPEEVLEAFQEYYQEAKLVDVSDPNKIWDLYDKLREAGIFEWTEVTRFAEVYYLEGTNEKALGNLVKPSVERWNRRYRAARDVFLKEKELFERAKKYDDAVLMANHENAMKEAKSEIDALGKFRGDLRTFTRYYDFMSQIIDYDSTDLETLCEFARVLASQLREGAVDDEVVDLSSVELKGYRLSKIGRQKLQLQTDAETGLAPASAAGTGKGRDKKEEFLSEVIRRMNELFAGAGVEAPSESDHLNYLRTISDKVRENDRVMDQIAANPPDQVMLGDFPAALDDAVMESGDTHQKMMMHYLNNENVQAGLGRLVLEMLTASAPEISP